MAGINGQTDGLFGKWTAVSPSTLAITTASTLPTGNIGVAYAQTLAATGAVPPYSNWSVTAGSLPPGLSLNTTTGILSGTPVAVSGTFYSMIAVKDSAGTTGSGSFQLTIQQPSTGLSRIGSFAQFASGGGWKSTITLINLSAVTVNAQVNLYSDNGSPITLPLTFPQFGSSMSAPSVGLTVPPNDSIVIKSNASTSPIGVGWADIQATGALSGYLSLALSPPGAPDLESTVPLDSRLSPSLLLPFDNTNGDQTGVALANQALTAQTITAIVLDQNGAQIGSAQISLPPFGHSSFFLSSQFSQSANQLGIIQFQGSGGPASGVTGVGLRFSPAGSFTSIPIIR
jgi:hypothetical protein